MFDSIVIGSGFAGAVVARELNVPVVFAKKDSRC